MSPACWCRCRLRFGIGKGCEPGKPLWRGVPGTLDSRAPGRRLAPEEACVKPLDRLLQRWRIAKARPFIPPGARVLDIGSADGALFRQLQDRIGEGLGIDPRVASAGGMPNVRLLRGFFPQDMPEVPPFDVITLLAVLEHFPDSQHAALAEGCARFLRPGGRLIITVPSPAVDSILKILLALRLAAGMSLEEHHGFDVERTVEIFGPPRFRLRARQRFELGLNHLFVFERAPD